LSAKLGAFALDLVTLLSSTVIFTAINNDLLSKLMSHLAAAIAWGGAVPTFTVDGNAEQLRQFDHS